MAACSTLFLILLAGCEPEYKPAAYKPAPRVGPESETEMDAGRGKASLPDITDWTSPEAIRASKRLASQRFYRGDAYRGFAYRGNAYRGYAGVSGSAYRGYRGDSYRGLSGRNRLYRGFSAPDRAYRGNSNMNGPYRGFRSYRGF